MCFSDLTISACLPQHPCAAEPPKTDSAETQDVYEHGWGVDAWKVMEMLEGPKKEQTYRPATSNSEFRSFGFRIHEGLSCHEGYGCEL